MKQTGNKILLTGNAQTNARITALMNSLDESPLLEAPKLQETRAENVGGRRLNAFSLEIVISKQSAQQGGAKK